jgi:hypothetical protein
MPKKKSQRNSRAVIVEPSKPVKPWVRWSAIIVIFALLVSIMLAAISSAPAKAATIAPSASPSVCKPIDTDHDGIPNNQDSDIDGDGIVNGKDPDIDGDGIPNAQDTDPAATNCEQSTTPPALNDNLNVDGTQKVSGIAWQWVIGVLAIGFGYLTLRQARRRK